MARARNIKPAFFQNESLGELDPLARLAFIGLWTVADYKGCVEFRPKRLKVQILPYDDCNFEQLMIALDKSGFISIYSVLDQSYIKVNNFVKHQNPHKNERESGSSIPDIPADYKNSTKNHEDSSDFTKIEKNLEQDGTARADSLLLNPDSLIPPITPVIPAKAGNNNKKGSSLAVRPDEIPEQVWNDYQVLRKRKKAPLTVTAFEGLRAEANKAGIRISDVLVLCCRNGWQGFQAEWLNKPHITPFTRQTKKPQSENFSEKNYGTGVMDL